MQPDTLPDRFRRHTVQPEEAQRLIMEEARTLEAERVSLREAWSRRLAEPLVASHPFPPFRRSGMDGYAVRAADIAEATPDRPAILAVVESLPSGMQPTSAIGPGQASRIMTGGMVPEGADAVVMLEATTSTEDSVRIGKPIPAGRNIADIGCEIATGELLLPAGSLIGAGESALLASYGCETVAVARRPRVAILSTGNELVQPGEPLAPAKIRNSNLPMLAAMVREAGAEPIVLGQVPDDAEEADRIAREVLSHCDLLLTTGGVSVGDYDVMVDVLAATDVRLLFNKIAMRPGSPTTAALLTGKLIVALSGNPGACFVGFQLFALPAIKRMLGVGEPYAESFQARLGVPFPKVNAYRRYIRGRTVLENGSVSVVPNGDDKSSLMKTIVGADCLIEIPPLKSGLEAGELVTAWKLG
ncbi:gephyrin-like molybdotransferase Glp [Cohnella sp. GCM10027633]|uniref:molybdopterin molybdotransferase MoeA n=1 Tax=unclassified Cohnella TaxID=2636738 RepID=UPI00363F88D9